MEKTVSVAVNVTGFDLASHDESKYESREMMPDWNAGTDTLPFSGQGAKRPKNLVVI